MRLTFVESRVFTARWDQRLDDEALRALQNLLLADPGAGDPMPGAAFSGSSGSATGAGGRESVADCG